MSGFPAPGSPARNGWLGFFGSWLQPGPDGGSRASEGAAGPPQELPARDRAPVCVLVVDDDPVNLMVISAQMKLRGLVTLHAADGAEAVALACELQFDLILMDLQMPVLDGWEATAAIRRFEAARSRPAVPIVAFSTSTPHAGVLAAHGLNGSLSKPCGDRELNDCLARWCPAYRPAPGARRLAGR
jgi:CheY-like chemotaxis protein